MNLESRISDLRFAALVFAAALVLSAACAHAQSIEVIAAAATPDAIARPGAYLPLGLRATNRSGEAVDRVRVTSGGPMDVTVPWKIAPGEESACLLPVFWTGSPLALGLEFLSARGRTIARAATGPVEVRPLADGAALLGVATDSGARPPDEATLDAVRRTLKTESLRVLHLGPGPLALAWRCGMLDAVVLDRRPDAPLGRAVAFPGRLLGPPRAMPLPAGVMEIVQPRAHRLFAGDPWPAADRRGLWLALGLLTLAALVAGVVAPRRRRAAAAVAMVLLGLAATAALWLFGDVRRARTVEARVFYAMAGGGCAMEHFAYLESRGGATARFRPAASETTPIPAPVLASSQDLFRPQATLLAGDDTIETGRPQALLHILTQTAAPPFGYAAPAATREALAALARRPDLVAALLVEGDRATDPAGRTQTLDGWAVEWQGSADAGAAYAGRSLAWWNADRRQGDAPAILAWWRDAPAAGTNPGAANLRLPALVVYTGGPAPQ